MKRESKVLIEELLKGINALKPDEKGAWGKMNVSEMLLHCSRFIDLYLGEISLPRWYKIFGVSIGRLFLWYVSKLDPTKTPRNLRTDKRIEVYETSFNFEENKALLLKNVSRLNQLNGKVNHPIYGRMTSEKIIFLIWHHTSHHLCQFGVDQQHH